MHQYVALETFFQAVQEINIYINSNHRQHFTLIDEVARSFCVLHLSIWKSPKAYLASWNTLRIATLSVQITRKVLMHLLSEEEKMDSNAHSALNN